MDEVTRSQETSRITSHFITELSNHLSVAELKRLSFGKITLADTELPYQPEAFVRHNLIHPLLEVADLEFQIEPESDTPRKTYPDFDITNTDIPFIGEAKPVNDMEEGEQEILSYLGEDGFNTPYGILTDGIEWRFYGPKVGREPGFDRLKTLSLNDYVLLSLKNHECTKSFRPSKRQMRSGINQAEAFGRFVNRDRLDTWGLERLPKEVRNEYQSTGRSLQASLGGYWSEL